MRLEAQKCLYDIQEAAAHAERFTAGIDFDFYRQNIMLRFAVERSFAIIGEALSQLVRVDAALANRITDLRSIIAFRNILVHAYTQIDDKIVWGIVQSKLPVLIREVKLIMTEEDEQLEP